MDNKSIGNHFRRVYHEWTEKYKPYGESAPETRNEAIAVFEEMGNDIDNLGDFIESNVPDNINYPMSRYDETFNEHVEDDKAFKKALLGIVYELDNRYVTSPTKMIVYLAKMSDSEYLEWRNSLNNGKSLLFSVLTWRTELFEVYRALSGRKSPDDNIFTQLYYNNS